jgi:hypothetical protein
MTAWPRPPPNRAGELADADPKEVRLVGDDELAGRTLLVAPYADPTERRRWFKRELVWRAAGRSTRHRVMARRCRTG